MKFYVKKYNFSPLKRVLVAGISALVFIFLLLGIHLSILVNSVDNFRMEGIANVLMNSSRFVYENFGEKVEKKKGSWLELLGDEEETGVDIFGFGQQKPTKQKQIKQDKKLQEEKKEDKMRDFSLVLNDVVGKYGLPKDEKELYYKNLWNVEVIVGDTLVASSDLEALDSQKISIYNLFRVKKDSSENNFVVEERRRGFFVGYDKVIKAFTFSDIDLTVGVEYIEKPIVIPFVGLIGFVVLSIVISLLFLLLKFIPENVRVYVGIVLLLVVGIGIWFVYSANIDSIVKDRVQEIKDVANFLYEKLNEKGFNVDKQVFFEYISNSVGDIRGVRFISDNGNVVVDESSLSYYLGIFEGAFSVFFVFILITGVGIFYYFARGGLEKWLNAFYNYSVVYGFIVFALLLVILLIGIPFLFTIIMSFTSLSRYLSDLNLARQFVGMLNYKEILDINHILSRIGFDWAQEVIEKSKFFVRNFGSFYDVFVNTFLYTVISVGIQLVLGITFAVILNDNKVKLRGVYQVLLILPWVLPTYISALLWREALGQYGVFKQLFDAIGLEGFNIYANSTVYFLSICFVSAWYAFPFIMIVALSGLQGISDSVKDAALIDGANWFTRLFSIYLPLIRPTLLPSVLLSSIWTFNNFNIVFLYTGGNDAYDILITRIYDFVSRPDLRVFTYGYAAAYSVLVFIILLMYILAFAKITRLTEKTY